MARHTRLKSSALPIGILQGAEQRQLSAEVQNIWQRCAGKEASLRIKIQRISVFADLWSGRNRSRKFPGA